MTPQDIEDTEKKISQAKSLLGFAAGVLLARDRVQNRMDQSRMGVFRETDISALPGVLIDAGDGSWLRLRRLDPTKAPKTEAYVVEFLPDSIDDPETRPELLNAFSKAVSIEEASDLEEAGLLRAENVHTIISEGIERDDIVRATLLAEDLPEMRRDFERWRANDWSTWAETERPIRKSIALYHAMFRISAAVHASDAVPPEIIWGFGLARWTISEESIDMPVVEQEVEIEIESGGDLVLIPRERAPEINLRPYIDLDIPGSHRLQSTLAEMLGTIRQGDAAFSPESYAILEPIFEQIATQLDSAGRFISMADRAAGKEIPREFKDLSVIAAWSVYVRPRSSAARVQDLEALSQAIEETGCVPTAIEGFVAPEPDPETLDSPFGIDPTVLGGSGAGYAEPEGQASGMESGMRPSAESRNREHQNSVYFFPLPYNEEQANILHLIEGIRIRDPAPVVSVTGPPGTGKSHTIANLVSHNMACGRRVLVAARTSEAISVVREKLPKSLRGLVITSTGTDRESTEQLKAAVSELSDEIVGLDMSAAQRERGDLEQAILNCDRRISEADESLADVAKSNLQPVKVSDESLTPMELVVHVEGQRALHAWFTDRPNAGPSASLFEALDRLRASLPELAPELALLGAAIPQPEDLPSTSDLIAAHEDELAALHRPKLDPSAFPPMAFDVKQVVETARGTLAGLQDVSRRLETADPELRKLIDNALVADDISRFETLLTRLNDLGVKAPMVDVRYENAGVALADLHAAALRGASNQKPAPGLFNRALKHAVGSVMIAGKPPAGTSDWAIVERTIRLEMDGMKAINGELNIIPASHRTFFGNRPGWEVAATVLKLEEQLTTALSIQKDLSHLSQAVQKLFPVGFEISDLKRGNVTRAAMAIEANLPDGHAPHAALGTLDTLAGAGTHAIFVRFRDLRNALGCADTDPQDLVRERADLTHELERLRTLAPKLEATNEDLSLLAANAPEWASRLRAAPQDVAELIPEDWQSSWEWARLASHADEIVRLGNGDEHRRARAEASAQRARQMEKLIRIRTMLGLKSRMTPSIQRAMQAFTQAVARVGKGTGKTAPRFRRAAQLAAREVAVAAPVWIMPEHRIAEQLPAEIGAFDLVILDEASQSDITAVTALARGKQVLVVGDEQQVSPSNVGISTQRIDALRAEYLAGLPNANLIDENTSIFEITMRMFPTTHVILREHFRSVAPIIQFSTQFYSNRLIPLRIPKASERFDPPLVDVFIDRAVRKGMTNPAEANFVVEEIARIVADPDHNRRDIGVVSLIGSEQAALIETKLLTDPRIGPEIMAERRIVCGDARTMQGQERSVMFLSMVATKDAVTAQTTRDTQQRLNVAMSRARDRVYLVRSVGIEHLKNRDLKRRVLEHFEDPMPEGRKEGGTDLMDLCESDFEREVLGKLLDAGYRARPQVSAGAYRIDIVVEGADDRRLAIELDGDKYHGPDRWAEDMARQAALERAGWVFWRVFGSQWCSEKDRWWLDLVDTLSAMKIEPIGGEAMFEGFVDLRHLDALHDLYVSSVSVGIAEGVNPDFEDEPDIPAVADISVGQNEAVRASDKIEETGRLETPDTEDQSLPLFHPNSAVPQVPQTTERTAENSEINSAIEAGVGCFVEIQTSDGRRIRVELVSKERHDPDKGRLGIHTPLGEALIGALSGEEVEYQSGPYLRTAKVLSVKEAADDVV